METARSNGPPARQVLRVTSAVLGVKAYVLLLLLVVFQRVDVRRDYEAFLFLREGQDRSERLGEVEESFIERLTPYDGQFYLDIAEHGYRRLAGSEAGAGRGPPGNYAFFPLVPLLLRAARAGGHEFGLGALLLGNVLLSTAAAVGLYVLAFRLGLPAWPSVLFLLAFPSAVFQNVLYTESLFLLLAVGVALASAAGRYGRGSLLGILAGLCRPQGILVASLWLGQLFRRKSASGGPRAAVGPIAAVMAPAVGMAAFAFLLWASIGAPLGFLGIQSAWARDFSISNLLREITSPGTYDGPPFDLVALLFGVGMVPLLWRHLPWPLAFYGTLSVAMPLATGTVLSFGRFMSVSFPHFLCLSRLFQNWPVATATFLGGSIVLQCMLAKGLVGWHFVG